VWSSSEAWLTPTDVKQYFYCRAIPYVNHVLGAWEGPTEYMAEGKEAHLNVEGLERRRRSLFKHLKVPEGSVKQFRVQLESARLRMRGALDCLLVLPSGEHVPVEYKVARRPRRLPSHHKYQLVAYAMLVEDCRTTVVRRGHIYYSESDSLAHLRVTDGMRVAVLRALEDIRAMVAEEREPLVRPQAPKCAACGLRRACPWSLV